MESSPPVSAKLVPDTWWWFERAPCTAFFVSPVLRVEGALGAVLGQLGLQIWMQGLRHCWVKKMEMRSILIYRSEDKDT